MLIVTTPEPFQLTSTVFSLQIKQQDFDYASYRIASHHIALHVNRPTDDCADMQWGHLLLTPGPDGLASLFSKSRIMLYHRASAWRERWESRATLEDVCMLPTEDLSC